MQVLSSYLPGSAPAGQGSTFSEAGALYALGLIHAGQSLTHGEGAKACVSYLLEQLRSSQNNETLQHGACLGLGLLCMGTANEEIYEELKQVLYRDSAVAGEAAGYAIGLIMLGSASEKAISELLPYAHETQHEKIIRACAMAMALIMFKREDEAETLIQQLTLEKDAVLR
jgi:26S proteasome regulatory subunit N2